MAKRIISPPIPNAKPISRKVLTIAPIISAMNFPASVGSPPCANTTLGKDRHITNKPIIIKADRHAYLLISSPQFNLIIFAMSYLTATYNLALFTPFTLLPPEEETEGIVVGEDTYHRKVYLNYNKLPNFHGIIIGPTGSGKSTTVESLLYDLVEQGVNVICIDPHQDYVSAIKDLNGVIVDFTKMIPDIFEYPGELDEHSISMWCDYLSIAAKVSVDIDRHHVSRLRLVLEEEMKGDGDVENVISKLDYIRREDPYYEELYVKCRDLFKHFREPNFSIIDVLKENKPASLVYSYEGRRIPPQVEKFLTLLLINQVNEYRRNNVRESEKHKLELVIVVDEAWRLLKMPGYESDFLNRIREMRKFGVGYWTITQSVSDLPTEAYEQAGFILALSGPQLHVTKVDAISALTEEDKDWLKYHSLPGFGVLLRSGFPKAAQIRILVRENVLRRRRKK